MTHQVKPVPEGHHTITPHLVVKGASQAIEFYKQAFGAEEVRRTCSGVIATGDWLIHSGTNGPWQRIRKI